MPSLGSSRLCLAWLFTTAMPCLPAMPMPTMPMPTVCVVTVKGMGFSGRDWRQGKWDGMVCERDLLVFCLSACLSPGTVRH